MARKDKMFPNYINGSLFSVTAARAPGMPSTCKHSNLLCHMGPQKQSCQWEVKHLMETCSTHTLVALVTGPLLAILLYSL